MLVASTFWNRAPKPTFLRGRSVVRSRQEAFRQHLCHVRSRRTMLETSDLSLTDAAFLADVKDVLFVERIEKILRQLNTNREEVTEVFDILNRHILERT